jgi:hypothetical protein
MGRTGLTRGTTAVAGHVRHDHPRTSKLSEVEEFWEMDPEDQDYLQRFPDGCTTPLPRQGDQSGNRGAVIVGASDTSAYLNLPNCRRPRRSAALRALGVALVRVACHYPFGADA